MKHEAGEGDEVEASDGLGQHEVDAAVEVAEGLEVARRDLEGGDDAVWGDFGEVEADGGQESAVGNGADDVRGQERASTWPRNGRLYTLEAEAQDCPFPAHRVLRRRAARPAPNRMLSATRLPVSTRVPSWASDLDRARQDDPGCGSASVNASGRTAIVPGAD